MAIRRQQYARELERQLAKGIKPKEAHEAAVEKSIIKKGTVKKKVVIKKAPKKKSTWVSRLKRDIKLLIKGPTVRTRTIEKGLKHALTEKEISKFRGKHSKKKGY